MPFKSEKQRKWMHANEPEMAKKWEKEESLTNESGILYKAGVKKYGKEGMKKIQQAAGKRKSHAAIGKIKDKYEKGKKESVSFLKKGIKAFVSEKMGPEQYHKYMQYVFDTQFKTPEEKKMKKSIIKKINVAQKKKGLPVFKEEFVEEGFGGELKGKDKEKFEKARKENAEQLGYKVTGVSDIKESVNEAQNKIADIRKILKTKKGKRIDSIFMDVETAEEVMKHYKSLGRGAKEKFVKQKIQNIVKSVKKESVNEGMDDLLSKMKKVSVLKRYIGDESEVEYKDIPLQIFKKLFGDPKKIKVKPPGAIDVKSGKVTVYAESVNEVQKRQATDIAVKFDKAYLNFSREIRDIIKMVVRITGNRTDGKIFEKSYTKHLIPFDELFKSWYRGQQNNPHISESDLGYTTKKQKVVRAVHKTSGKEIIVVDTPSSRKTLKKIGFVVKESVNEAVKVRNGEAPMEGMWAVCDISTGKAIKEVGNARAATRLMNRLMNSGQYKEVAAKWVGEAKSKTMTTIGSIIGKKQAQKISGVLVDMQTALVIMKVWNALNKSNRSKFEKLPIKKMANVAWKLMK